MYSKYSRYSEHSKYLEYRTYSKIGPSLTPSSSVLLSFVPELGVRFLVQCEFTAKEKYNAISKAETIISYVAWYTPTYSGIWYASYRPQCTAARLWLVLSCNGATVYVLLAVLGGPICVYRNVLCHPLQRTVLFIRPTVYY